jgi:hypothetical protein
LKTGTLIFDYTGGSTEESLVYEIFDTYDDIAPETFAEALTWWTGLNFDATVSFDDRGLNVDWRPSSTLIAGLEDGAPEEGFAFSDADSLRWFMMDSMWRTLANEYGGDVFFTMNGGLPLEFDELYPVKAIPIGAAYLGSQAYFGASEGEAVSRRHYLDASNLIGMYYPEEFTSRGSHAKDGSAKFDSVNANARMSYWMEEDFVEHPEKADFVKEYKELGNGSTVALGQDEEYGTYLVCIWIVDPELYFGFESADWHAAASIECPSEEYAKIWFENLKSGAISFYTADGLDDSYFRTAGEAMEILAEALAKSGKQVEGAALAEYGEDTLNGLKVYLFAYGMNSEEKYTAEEHFGVSVYGEIYQYDLIGNEYKAFN